MSDNENSDTNDKKNLIGIDPLAWLSDEEKASLPDAEQQEQTDTSNKIEPESSANYVIQLDTMLTIRDASELLEELKQIDDAHQEIIIESEQVERVDTAALQLLLSFYLFATDAGKQVIWNKPSDVLCHAFELLGLKELVNIDAAITT